MRPAELPLPLRLRIWMILQRNLLRLDPQRQMVGRSEDGEATKWERGKKRGDGSGRIGKETTRVEKRGVRGEGRKRRGGNGRESREDGGRTGMRPCFESGSRNWFNF